MNYKTVFVGIFVLIFAHFGHAQESEWQLKRKTKQLKVYTRNIAETGIKELKITTQFETSLNSITALLSDVPANTDWVYSSKVAKITEQVSPGEMYYYSVSDFPWPLQDRDLIVHSIIEQDPVSKVMTSISYSAEEKYPLQKGIVRVTVFDSKWIFTPLPNGKIDIEYTVKTDPGGNIPVFLTNNEVEQTITVNIYKERCGVLSHVYLSAIGSEINRI